MRAAVLMLPFLLAACAGGTGTPARIQASAVPSRALVYQVGLNVIMSDGRLCVGHRPGRQSGWTGQLNGCPYPMDYQVTNADPRVVRQELRLADAAGPGTTAQIGSTLFTAP